MRSLPAPPASSVAQRRLVVILDELLDRRADDVLQRRLDELGETLVAVDDVAAGTDA